MVGFNLFVRNIKTKDMLEKILEEIKLPELESFKLGEYIYMGMGKVGEKTVVLSIGYKMFYCIKKATQFENNDNNVKFTHINKVKVGELIATERFGWSKKLLNDVMSNI